MSSDKRGVKHLIECHCVLKLYKNVTPVVYHKFLAYSKIDEKGNIIPKYANCNNCGITHLVYEICKSEIKIGKEDISSIRTKEDIALSLPEKIVSVLEKYKSECVIYEEIEDVLENSFFPTSIILKREIIDESHHLKILNITGDNKFSIISDVINQNVTGR